MVCIAAFIVLIIIGVFVAFLSIFNRKLGKNYLKVLKKSWYCFGKKVRLQKCDTNFDEDVKTMLLKKVVLKRPKWVKPLSVAIEVGSILIVFISVWSIVESAKAGLALWTFGTCNVSQPSSCALGAESCSIDKDEPKNPIEWVGRWFSEWGEIFTNIPDRLKTWDAGEYYVEGGTVKISENGNEKSLNLIDPGCVVCMQTYKNQKRSGFFDKYDSSFMVYPIETGDNEYKFPNSGNIARYIYTLNLANHADMSLKIIDRLFTEFDKDGKFGDKGVSYQSLINKEETDIKPLFKAWLKEWGMNDKDIKAIEDNLNSDKTTEVMNNVKTMVNDTIKIKGIPTEIYDGRKNLGLYKVDE